MVRYLVLGLLREGKILHGYALVRAYNQLSGLQLSGGNVYRELQRLSAEGLVRAAAKSPDAGPRRTPYEITEAGAQYFDAWFIDLRDDGGTHHEDALSLRALFLGIVDTVLARRLLERWRDLLWSRSKALEREHETALLQRGDARPGPFPARDGLLTRRLKLVTAELESVDEFRRMFDTWMTKTRRPAEPLPTTASAAKPKRRGGRTTPR